MDVKNIDNDKFLVTVGPTQSKMLNEIAFKRNQDSDKVLANLVFCSIATEHSAMKLDEAIAKQTDWNQH